MTLADRLGSARRSTTRARFTSILGELFGDGGTTIPRPIGGAADRRRGFLAQDCANERANQHEEDRVGLPSHALTFVQPDGDIVTRLDPCAPADEVAGHLEDVQQWIVGYQETIRRHVLNFQLWAVGVLVAVPQLASAVYNSFTARPWYWIVAVVTAGIPIGLQIADRSLKEQRATKWYAWFRRVRDGKYYGHVVTGVSTAIAVGGAVLAWFGERSTAERAVMGATLVAIVAVLVIGSYLLSRRLLATLRGRFL